MVVHFASSFLAHGIRLVFVARGAGIRDAGLLGLLRGDEAEGVSGDVVILDGLLDPRHVTGGALAAGAAWCVMGVSG